MDVLYKITDGVTIESLLGQTIANFFLANWENHIFKNKSQHCRSYVDDVFAVFENNNACLSFLNLLNI